MVGRCCGSGGRLLKPPLHVDGGELFRQHTLVDSISYHSASLDVLFELAIVGVAKDGLFQELQPSKLAR